ncbi:hypothetical protein FA10DRAFT_282748 [Acaromyces ingoldii]|uniref:Apple domain-containing protein n=1 Tax=Acaromyces ingoldii TaxID=215250 RepID=A0A316YWN0_9BASI|nr:hypothetical protein FA10DRAFT_282748 [Acaromyces ingoldii]PWN93078.1 hypothetical protein FA10DRAFT_282748 [Acaromyces ingoldii]
MKTTLFLVSALAVAAGAQASHDDGAEARVNRRTFGKHYLSDEKCYGAAIPPWLQHSTPGWCKGKQPSHGSLPPWDGGDAAQCKRKGAFGGPVCKGGNPPGHIPSGCKPPTHYPGHGGHGGHGGHKPGHGGHHHSTTKATSTESCSTEPTPTTTSTTSAPTSTGAPEPICTGPSSEYQLVFEDYETTATTGVYTGKKVGAATQDNDNYLTYGLTDTIEECLELCDQVNGCVFVNTYHDQYDGSYDDLPESAQKKYDPSKLTCALFKACEDPDKANDNWGGQNDPNYITESNGYCKSSNCPVKSA